MWSFRRPGGSGTEQPSSDAAVVLFFLKKRKKRMGAQKTRAEQSPAPTFTAGTAIEYVGAAIGRPQPIRLAR